MNLIDAVIPDTGFEFDLVAIAEVMQLGVPRIYPDAQRSLDMKSWTKKVGPWDLRHLGVPVLVHVNGVLYVTDGQHRIAKLAELGYTHFYAQVGIATSVVEAAQLFVGCNESRPIARRVKTRIQITAQSPEWVAILAILKHNGFSLRRAGETTTQNDFFILEGDATLIRLYRKGVLDNVLYVYGGLGKDWALHGSPSKFLNLLGALFAHHGGINRTRLVQKLASTKGLLALERIAAENVIASGRAYQTMFIWELVKAYNTGLPTEGGGRLPLKTSY